MSKNLSGLLSEFTYSRKQEMWFNNFGENLPVIRSGMSTQMITKVSGPAIILGAGPSVGKYGFLDKLRAIPPPRRPTIYASDRALSPAIEHDLTPYVVASVDSDVKVAPFYDTPAVQALRNTSRQYLTRACLATTVHPSVVARCPFERYWFNIWYDDPTRPGISLSRAMHYMSGYKPIITALGNVGAWLAGFASELGNNPIILTGIDFSYGDETSPMQTPSWEYFLARNKRNVKDTISKCYRYFTNPSGKRVLTDLGFLGYQEVLMRVVQQMKAEVWVCSEYSIMYGEGLKWMTLDEALQKI